MPCKKTPETETKLKNVRGWSWKKEQILENSRMQSGFCSLQQFANEKKEELPIDRSWSEEVNLSTLIASGLGYPLPLAVVSLNTAHPATWVKSKFLRGGAFLRATEWWTMCRRWWATWLYFTLWSKLNLSKHRVSGANEQGMAEGNKNWGMVSGQGELFNWEATIVSEAYRFNCMDHWFHHSRGKQNFWKKFSKKSCKSSESFWLPHFLTLFFQNV